MFQLILVDRGTFDRIILFIHTRSDETNGDLFYGSDELGESTKTNIYEVRALFLPDPAGLPASSSLTTWLEGNFMGTSSDANIPH